MSEAYMPRLANKTRSLSICSATNNKKEASKMNKATYKGKSYGRGYDKGTTYLFYEYRGHEYMVEDRHWKPSASDMTLALQHRRAQAEIDELIDRQSKPEEPCRYEDTADYALDKLNAYFNGDESAFF